MRRGAENYEQGMYINAKKVFTADVLWEYGSREEKAEALKYLAFVYCLEGLERSCTQAFARALLEDPGFELAEGEKGHPLWEPSFNKASLTYQCYLEELELNTLSKESACR